MSRLLLPVVAAALFFGCSHLQRTDALDQAHSAYEKAQKGAAASSSPADLATAQKFLDLADKGLDSGDPKVVDDRAKVAMLKLEAAEALGRTHTLADERDKTVQEVSLTKQQLLDTAQQKLAQTEAELEKEKTARDTAEIRLDERRAVLARETQVQDLPEGTVITLPGGQLFARGGAELLPAGRDRLSRVAEFLKTASRAARVEAQPASRGSRSVALALSSKRAERVREFLVAEGVTPTRIRAEPADGNAPVRPLPAGPEFASSGAVNIVLEPGGTGGGTSPGRP